MAGEAQRCAQLEGGRALAARQLERLLHARLRFVAAALQRSSSPASRCSSLSKKNPRPAGARASPASTAAQAASIARPRVGVGKQREIVGIVHVGAGLMGELEAALELGDPSSWDPSAASAQPCMILAIATGSG